MTETQILPVEEFAALSDHPLPPSDWLLIDQARIDAFAEATGDYQFIHVDPDRAAATPFGSTIAHGFLTLSLLPHLTGQRNLLPENLVMGINYGLNKLRFLEPVPVNSEVRSKGIIRSVAKRGRDRLLVTSEVTVEIKGRERPALVAEVLTLYVVDNQEGE